MIWMFGIVGFSVVSYSTVSLVTVFGNNYLEQVIIGNLLGDAWLERKSPTANARLRYEQTHPNHSEQFFFVWKFYAMWCVGYATIRTRFDKRSNTTRYINHFTTRSMPFFTYYYNLFYVNGVKTVPINIGSFLTAVSLAFWIIDDGHHNKGLVLNTQGFSIDGVNLLVSALNTNFGFHSYIRYEDKLPVIYIPVRDLPLLRTLVLSHIHPSTHYKLGI